MLWLWILGALAAIFALFCLTRLGVRVVLGETVSAQVTFGIFKIQVAPSKKGKNPKKEKAKKPKKPKTPAETPKKLSRPAAEDLKLAYRTLWPPAKRALERTRRGVRFSPLTLAVTIPGKADPALAAEGYGWANAAVWTVMPVLEQLLDIPDPAIRVDLDFDRERWLVRGELGLSLRIGTLMALGFGTMLPTVRWLLRYRKAHSKPAEKPAAAPAGTQAA